MKSKPFATEVDLCKAFVESLPAGWIAYPETADWDILLVRKTDGFQIGVQAKLALNVHVIGQALEEGGAWWATREGPDCRAVLVPGAEGRIGRIASYIGITVIRLDENPVGNHRLFWPHLPRDGDPDGTSEWHDWASTKRCVLPAYVPDVAAGSPAPLQLTNWKIAALKIEATIEIRGWATRADFAHHRIDHRRWLARENGWLVNDGGKLVRGPRFPNFSAQHPRNYAEIKADLRAAELEAREAADGRRKREMAL